MGAREGKRECASLLAPAPSEDRTQPGVEGQALNHLPNVLFQKLKEKGPKQPYTKYSVASPKGCTEFLALSSTECVPTMHPPRPWPLAVPTGAGGGSRFNLLPAPSPQPGESAGEGLGRLSTPVPSPFPFKGWARPFFPSSSCHTSPLSPSPSSTLGSPPSLDHGKVEVPGKRTFKLSFFSSLSVSSLKKKIHIPVPIRGNPSRSLTLTRNQKEKSPHPPHAPLILAEASSSPPHTCIPARTPAVGFLAMACPSGSIWQGQCHDLWSSSKRALWWPPRQQNLPQVLAGPCV